MTQTEKYLIQPVPFQKKLKQWFMKCGRHDLPWQINPTPYRVWVSEIMLQQTQVITVIPFYARFMARFPTLTELAQADINDVITLWAGLGYYARARNLHKAAIKIMLDHAGILPNTQEGLEALPGVGRSTAGAILSLSGMRAAPILEGNVKRILCRLFGITGVPNDKKVDLKLWEIATHYTPKKTAQSHNQAMMDLGATLCYRTKPLCEQCPFLAVCYAALNQQQSALPERKKKLIKPQIQKWYLLIFYRNMLRLEKRPPTGIWSNLWVLPEFSTEKDLIYFCQQKFDLKEAKIEKAILHPVKHSFTHFDMTLHFLQINLTQPDKKKQPDYFLNEPNNKWFLLDENLYNTIGMPAPIQKILKKLIEL